MAIKKDTLDGLLAGRDPQAVFAANSDAIRPGISDLMSATVPI